jgi:site-specific recombinase XerD
VLTRQRTESRHARVRAEVLHSWRDLGYASDTIEGYLQWVARHRSWCRARGVDQLDELTRRSVDGFARSYARARKIDVRTAILGARTALHTWAKTVARFGCEVPVWRSREARPFDELMARYSEFRRRWRGVMESSLRAEWRGVTQFLKWLRRRRLPLTSVTYRHIDRFVIDLSSRLRAKTVAGVCSALRSFLRFLHATGATPNDMAAYVQRPQVRRRAEPPRVRPWREVCRILRGIDRRTTLGMRDYAALLMMAAYGMGAGEALSLQLDDIDWRGGSFRITRPKTGVQVVLPLLGPVGRALTSYLRHGRARPAKTRTVFVRGRAPFPPLAVRELGKRFRAYARSAGISALTLGTHVLRRCHATREVEMAAPAKVVSDILGHDDPSSLSVYAAVATERLRDVCLPLPR